MNNIIVNSALWYAEQSNQFLIYSGADKLLGKGFDYYAAEFIPLGHKLVKNGQLVADAMDGELAAQFSMAYATNFNGVCHQLLAIRQDRIQLRTCVSEDAGGNRRRSNIL